MSFSDVLTELLPAALITLHILIMALPLAAGMAFLAGLMRLSGLFPLKQIVVIYIEVFRGSSALIQLFWVFYVLPLFGITIEATTAGIITLGLHIGAYGAEVVRSAVQAVPSGQYEAAIALNFSPLQRMTRVILPQALVNMIAPFGNLSVELMKLTSLVSLITITDLTYQAKTMADMTLQVGLIFSVVLLIYFVIARVLALFFSFLEQYCSRGLNRGGV